MSDRSTSSAGDKLGSCRSRVLIVEDEPIIGFALEDILVEMGYDVIAVTSEPGETLKIIEQDCPDLAILDVNLRGCKSYPIADELKRRGVKYLFATGYGDAHHPQEHANVETVTKPYSPADLSAAFTRLNA